MYADIEAAWNALRKRYGISPESVIFYGQSIGTVPTVDLASRFEVAAVILHSPLMSGMRVAFPSTKRTWCWDPFPRLVGWLVCWLVMGWCVGWVLGGFWEGGGLWGNGFVWVDVASGLVVW